jgi:Ca2+-binding RTX toxin-like protein
VPVSLHRRRGTPHPATASCYSVTRGDRVTDVLHRTIRQLRGYPGRTANMLHRNLRRGIVVGATGIVLLLGSTGVAVAATFIGTNGDDFFPGTSSADNIVGLGGDDGLFGEVGNDNIVGGGGDDDIRGGRGNDRLSGGADDDSIRGGRGRDTISAGGGEDTIDLAFVGTPDGERDVVSCGDGNDTVIGAGPEDVIAPNCESVNPH